MISTIVGGLVVLFIKLVTNENDRFSHFIVQLCNEIVPLLHSDLSDTLLTREPAFGNLERNVTRCFVQSCKEFRWSTSWDRTSP